LYFQMPQATFSRGAYAYATIVHALGTSWMQMI
jgi:hypothetical protein